MLCSSRYRFFDHDSASWFTNVRIPGGSDWKSDYDRANIAFVFITLIVLIASCLWAAVVKKPSPAARKTFVWFMPAIVFAIIVYIWTAIGVIIIEECALVEQLYYIFDSILGSFQILEFAFLLAAIYIFVIPFTRFSGSAVLGSRSSMSPMLAGHLAFCGLLIIFWLVIFSLQLALVVQGVKDVGGDSEGIYKAFVRTNFTFDLLYLLGSIEVIVLSASFFTTCTGRNKQIAALFLFGVSVPLFILYLWIIVINGITTFDYYFGLTPQVLFAHNLFVQICTMAIFASFAFVMTRFQLDDEAQTDSFQPTVVQQHAPRVAGGLEPGWDRSSTRDHSQDPIYNGPELRHDV
ncbi:MAG: hypothetical protein L6R37_006157 [Teloschistes peruensis]|nr:MAG: hypothetical protein L6R37_006157 [Teloschistes peruensis]